MRALAYYDVRSREERGGFGNAGRGGGGGGGFEPCCKCNVNFCKNFCFKSILLTKKSLISLLLVLQ